MQLHLESPGGIPLCTIGDSAFTRHIWLLKGYPEEIKLPQQSDFNRKLCSAGVVTENTYAKLKGRWRISYKKTSAECLN